MTRPKAATRLLDYIQAEDWEAIRKRLKTHPLEARRVDPSTGWTPLHYATTIKSLQSTSLVTKLAFMYPAALNMRCNKHGYTPLALLCHSKDVSPEALEHDADLARIILGNNTKKPINKTSKNGHKPLILHILAMSRLKMGATLKQSTAESSIPVLRALVEYSTKTDLEIALEKLFACNTFLIMQRFAQEEACARRNIRNFGRQTRPSSLLQDFWVWEWALVILEGIHDRRRQLDDSLATEPFHPLHVASQVTDCPTPFLTFAMRAFPTKMRSPDRQDLNLPLHSVAGWSLEQDSSLCRKSMIFTSMAMEYPDALQTKNRSGLTPRDILPLSGSDLVAWRDEKLQIEH